MPFDAELTAVYERLIKPGLEAAGYLVERADSILDRQNVLRDIVRRIENADLIVADLTSGNANVFYELGLAHALEKATVLIAQRIEEIPFDLKSYRIEVYSTHFASSGDLTDRLRQIAESHARGSITFGNPVTDFRAVQPPAVGESAASESTHPEDADAGAGGEGTRGFLDHMRTVELSQADMERLFNAMGEVTETVGDAVQQRSAEIEELVSRGRPSPSRAHEIARRAATDFERYAERMEALLEELHPLADELLEAVVGLAEWIGGAADVEQSDLESNREEMLSLAEGSRVALDGLRAFSDVARSLVGISADLDRASARVLRVLARITTLLERFDAAGTRGAAMIQERLEVLGGHGIVGDVSQETRTEAASEPSTGEDPADARPE